MSVVMEKATDGTAPDVMGTGWNSGTGTIRFIGGVPTRKVHGAVIRVGGRRIKGVRVNCVVIEPVTGDWHRAALIMADGAEYPIGAVGALERLRGEWIQRTLSDGTFAGVARMR